MGRYASLLQEKNANLILDSYNGETDTRTYQCFQSLSNTNTSTFHIFLSDSEVIALTSHHLIHAIEEKLQYSPAHYDLARRPLRSQGKFVYYFPDGP